MQQEFFNFLNVDTQAVLSQVAEVVGSTLGPNGKSVILGNGKKTFTTKDGVSVLRFISSQNPFIQNVINVIRETAENALREAGDGTTSTIILANELLKLLNSKYIDKNSFKEKINAMIEKLYEIAKPLTKENAKQLIETAVGNEKELVEVLYQAYLESEKHNLPITIEPALGKASSVKVMEGIYFKAKIASQLFENKEVIVNNPHIICYSGIVETEREVIKAIDKALSLGAKNMVIIANGYTEEALAIMSINHLKGTIHIVPLVVSGGDLHNNDIITLIAKSLDAEIGGESFSTRLYDSFTKLYDKVEVFRYDREAAVFEGIKANTNLSDEIAKYEKKLIEAKDDKDMNKYLFLLSILKRKMIKVIIGANLENKLNELKDRADDALHSLLNAKRSGVVKGAGETYILLNEKTKDNHIYENAFSVIRNKLGNITGGLDAAKTVEAVLKSSSELALLLHNVSFVVNVEIK